MTAQTSSQTREALRTSFSRRGPGRPARFETAVNPRQALSRLLEYLKPFKVTLVLVTVFVVIYTLLGLLGPYLMGRAIDQFIGGKNPAGLLRTVLFMLGAYLANNLFQAAASLIMARVSQDALKLIRRDLFEHLQQLSIGFFDTHPTGGLMSRLTNDVDAINQAVSQNVVSLIASLLTMLGIIVTMFLLNAWLALGTLVVIPIMLWFSNFVAKYTRKGFQNLQYQLGGLNAITEEAFSGQKVIKAFRHKDSVTLDFDKQNQAVYKAGVYANSYALLLMPLTFVLGNFFVVVMAGLGGWLALRGLVTVGLIATFINYGQNFVSPLRQISNIFNSIQAALAGAERVFEIIDAKPEIMDSPQPVEFETIQGEVDFEHVSFGYVPEVTVIKDMTLKAKPGQMIALVGPTGAGKTTIVNLLTRFYEIQDGKISIDGVDIRDVRKDDLRKKLGLVLQDTFLFSGTVMENIRFGRLEATDEECVCAAELADADHFIRSLQQGYQTQLGERAGNLSQGQRQLLSIARAILADPAILILDEATSSVDTRTEARIQKSLLKLMDGRTSFVIAHRLSTIRDADVVVVIDDGRIVEQGTHDELLAKQGFYHHLYMSQFKGQAI
ncbi:MAG TPA: ABC transporter ATP-binding protein [Anaerolineaceae bacterium]|nr:ABC transporter ATP-binding protein [Anaerolineaceae bacterium]